MNIQETSAKASLDMTTLFHTDIWFKDGNIVLIAGSFAFKVHSGQLERHSEMFAGMLDVPQPTVQDVLDECPVVEMHDSPDDLYHFLIALYDGLQVPFPRPVMFAHLAAVLRISTKYIVSHLRHQCLARLKSDWPSTLEGWDARENQASSPRGCYSPRQYTAHPILVIELAIEFGLNEILPSAFYDLSRYGPSKIMYGTPGIGSVLSSPGIEPRPVCLSNQLLVRTLQGRELAQNYLINFLSLHLETRQPSSGCWYRNSSPPSKAHPCAQAFQQMYIDIFRCIGGVSIGRDADPLFTLSQGMDRLTRPDKSEGERAKTLICGSCKVELLSDCTKGREAAWALIPEWFGLVEESKDVSNDENRVD
ncbi:uncharacterized protein C8R40DRAFT_1158997 [Lentinula edodes]|uniref:uncharacterized protein n=1 Tax=Lentinula edodes TaxID=5353 RepID=UPI001E8EDEF1|nr:uncharacterized protein C8R40DRAFT_1158997 [Lentinula edodes]KAH7878432.1 hypothetical protein C8R40DRAFT_1158997 [Lentinula edodes]